MAVDASPGSSEHNLGHEYSRRDRQPHGDVDQEEVDNAEHTQWDNVQNIWNIYKNLFEV